MGCGRSRLAQACFQIGREWCFPRRIGGRQPSLRLRKRKLRVQEIGRHEAAAPVFLKTPGLTKARRAIILNHMVQYRTSGVNRVAAAISDPTRRAIIDRLARGPARISDIAAPFAMSLTGFCKHVRVLERARLIRRTRRGRENTLELSPEPLRDVALWILRYEQFWRARLDRLEKFFANEKEPLR
jgi:DNA-binding transcriptional ArsR family regulator